MTDTATEYEYDEDETYEPEEYAEGDEYVEDADADAEVEYDAENEYVDEPGDGDEPGTDMAVVEHNEPVEVAPLTERQAKALHKKVVKANDKWNTDADELFDLLEQAAAGKIHIGLGYASWTAWFSETVQLRPQDREQRKQLVRMMTDMGMSQRAAAKSLNVAQKTVDRDLEGVETSESDTVTSLDGAQRPRTKAKTIVDAEVVNVEEAEPERGAADVVDDFGSEIDTLLINVQAFKDVLDDELFPKARKRIAQRFVKRLNGAINDLTKIMEEITA